MKERVKTAMAAGRQGQCGQSVVEFALVLPVLFMLTVGLIDVGRAFYEYNGAAHAAREAARFAAVTGGSQNPSFDWGNPSSNPWNGNWPNTYSAATGHPPSQYAGSQTIVGTAVRTLPASVDLRNLVVAVTAPAGVVTGNPIQVRLDYAFQPATSLFVGGRPITMTASSQMIIE